MLHFTAAVQTDGSRLYSHMEGDISVETERQSFSWRHGGGETVATTGYHTGLSAAPRTRG